jgi:hypothetical protein
MARNRLPQCGVNPVSLLCPYQSVSVGGAPPWQRPAPSNMKNSLEFFVGLTVFVFITPGPMLVYTLLAMAANVWESE